MSRLLYLILLLVWCGAAASSTSQQPDPPILSVRTDLVTLSVVVLDRNGAPVTGLRPERFTVYDEGERQTIQFFASEPVPATIGLLVDSSGSMRGRRDEVTLAARALAPLPQPGDEFFTLNFNEAVWPGLPSHTPFTHSTEQLYVALQAAPARGMTALFDAVERGLRHLERGTGDRKALILISDGGDNVSSTPLAAVVEHARRSDVVVYSVRLPDPDNRDARPAVLKTLARETGGWAFAPASPDGIIRSFAQIAHELRSGYVIGFAPTDAAATGFRTLRVAVDHGSRGRLIARTRAGYYAGPSTGAVK